MTIWGILFWLNIGLLRNMMFASKVRCLNLWYAKHSYLNVMKLTAFTKLSLRVVCIKFLSNWSIQSICYSFKSKYYLRFSRPSFRCSIIMTFMHRCKYFIDSKIEFISFIYSYYVLYANIGVYQKSYDFI